MSTAKTTFSRTIALALLLTFSFALLACSQAATPAETQPIVTPPTPTPSEPTTPTTPDTTPPMTTNRHAIIETNKGTFEIELFEDKAPLTTANFITLAQKGYYDGVVFHRVIPDFMIQGGDPTGTGRGGPGYVIKDEFGPGLKHDKKGMLSMANAGPNTGGSQFFVTVAPTPWLDGKHAIFGHVVKGQDVVDAISLLPRDAMDRPKEAVTMQKVTIVNP